MLTSEQERDVWENLISSEVRALYFGDLASEYSKRKQWITGLSFFLSSSAVATLIAKLPVWVPLTCTLLVALMTAYAVAINLDSQIRTMAKLHYSWTQIGHEYSRLWNHIHDRDAEATFNDLQQREAIISELATTDAPNEPKRILRWQEQVFKLRHLEGA